MGYNQAHVMGRERSVFAKLEATFGTFTKPAATDAIAVTKSRLFPVYERKPRLGERRNHRGVVNQITGKKRGGFELEGELWPSGAAGTAPDIGPLLKAMLGTETVVGSTSVTYGLTSTQGTQKTFTLIEEASQLVSNAVRGAIMEELTLTFQGANEAKWKLSGPAVEHIHTGTSTLNGAVSTSDNITVQTADAANFEVGSIVKIGTNDNSGAGFMVETKTGPALNVDATLSADTGSAVVPFTPTPTYAGAPVAGVLGGVTIDSVDTPITAGSITWKNNHKLVDDEFGAQNPTDFIDALDREITGSLTIRARKDKILLLGKRKAFTAQAVVITIGETAGHIVTVTLPQVEMVVDEGSGIDIPESEEATINLNFKALATASGNDESTIAFT